MPLAALFILFDFVIHNPTHSDTEDNLVLLDVAGKHFRHLDSVSSGMLPGNTISEFAGIAQRYVNKFRGDRSGSEFAEDHTPSTDESVPSSQNATPPPAPNDFGRTRLQLTGAWRDGSHVSGVGTVSETWSKTNE